MEPGVIWMVLAKEETFNVQIVGTYLLYIRDT